MKPEPVRLPDTITVPRTDPIYNCHTYLTKVPIGAIQPFIRTFTKPGEVVVDFFAGSGMTGLAALTLNRRARLSDISVLGKHIATGYLTDAPARDIRAVAHGVMAAARKAVGTLYMTKRGSDGVKVEMIRTIWSFIYLCPSCGDEMVFYEALNARGGVPQRCPSCGGPFARRNNIFYSDMNLFQEAWLGETTDHAREAVVHTTGKRKNGSGERYEELLRSAFSEAFRVLKPGRHMSVVFGNSSGRIWGLVQRALRDAGFKASPVHVAILDKGQRSVKGLNSGSEGVVTVDLIVTMQKPSNGEGTGKAATLANGDTDALIRTAIEELSADEARNPSHVYARILRKAIQKGLVLDNLHLGDVLIALRNAGYGVDRKTGLLYGDFAHSAVLRNSKDLRGTMSMNR